jgi:hypothetical protein
MEILTFKDVAGRLQSGARIQLRLPYWNKFGTLGSSIGFSYFCEWFEVNVHDSEALRPEDAQKFLEASPDTRLEDSTTDAYGNARWFGGAWVASHHVRVWYNPQGI